MIVLCRHGQTEWTITGQHTGASDIPLTKEGEIQATKMGDVLQKLTFTKTFTSPRLRAIQTSTLAGFHGEIDPDLAEWNYGDFEGLTSAEIQKIAPNWNLFTDGAPNGESLQQVSDRADRFLKKIHTIEGTIAVFSHGHFSRVLAARFLGLTIPQASILYLLPASISKLGHEHKRPVIKLWNSTSHFN